MLKLTGPISYFLQLHNLTAEEIADTEYVGQLIYNYLESFYDDDEITNADLIRIAKEYQASKKIIS